MWNDVYSQPEKFDLTPIFETDLSDGDYQFSLFVVWRHKDGSLYWADDSGCSCPSPFEDFTSLDSLSTGNFADLHRDAMAWLIPEDSPFAGSPDAQRARVEVVEFLGKLRAGASL